MKLFTARYVATLCLIVAPASYGEQFSLGADTLKKNPDIPELDCVIEPSEIVDAGSSVPGLIEAINVDRSDLINAGEVLARLESSVESAALQKARAQARTNASIKLREESLKLGKITESRNAELLSMSAISKQDMEQLQTESRIAELQVEQEKHNKRVAQLEYQRSKAALDRLTIRSPIDGVITDRFKAVGEYVEDEPVIRIAKLDPLYVEVVVPVDHLGAISAGMKAEVAPSASGLSSYLATVERVDRVADAASGTYGVRLSLENPDYAIPAGLRCKVSFLPATEKQQENIAAISQGDVKNRQDHWVRSHANKAQKDAGKSNIASTTVAENNDSSKIEVAKNTVAEQNIIVPSATETATKPSINRSSARQDLARENSAAKKIVDAAVAINGDTVEPMDLLLLASIEKSTQIYIPEKSAETRTPVAPVKMPAELMRALEISPDASDATAVKTDTSTVPDQKAAISRDICYSIGPVTTERLAHQLEDMVAGKVAFNSTDKPGDHLRKENVSVTKGYFILAKTEQSDEAIGVYLDRLNDANFEDHMLLLRGTHKGRISLGYFHGHESARQRVAELEQKGFSVEMAERLGSTQQYWLDFTGPDQKTLRADLQKIVATIGSDTTLQSLDCAPNLASR